MSKPGSRERVALIAVPVLLVAVAVFQVARAAVLDQSSFAGYGFGMFATYENQQSRWTEIHATLDDGTIVRRAPPVDLDLATREVPTEGNLRALALAVIADDPSVRSVHGAVWSVEVSGRPMQVQRTRLNQVVVTVP